jgi:DNA-binding response OmpR family regulator
MKVLIAEIESATLNDITSAFNKYMPHWQLLTTDAGKVCLDVIRDNCPDIIILDSELADMPGLDVLEQSNDYSKVPVMFLSRKRDEFTAVNAFNAGAAGYMTKPVRQRELVARVMAMVRYASPAGGNQDVALACCGAPA